MRIGIIGRSAMLFNVMKTVHENGHDIVLVVTSKEAPEYDISADDFKNYAQKHNIPFIYHPNVNFASVKTIVDQTEKIDLAISINYTGIIPTSIINLFTIGILNMHSGDLPRYRGNAVVAWAMINGEKEIVNCIHKMIGGELDSGDILIKDRFPLNGNTKIKAVFKWLENTAPSLFLEVLEKLAIDPTFILEKQSTDPEKALRCYPRKPEDGLIDWKLPAKEIMRLINASSEPFSGAYTHYKGKKLTIWEAELHEDNIPFLSVPGQVTEKNKESFVVATGQGKLRIMKIGINDSFINAGELIGSLRDRLG